MCGRPRACRSLSGAGQGRASARRGVAAQAPRSSRSVSGSSAGFTELFLRGTTSVSVGWLGFVAASRMARSTPFGTPLAPYVCGRCHTPAASGAWAQTSRALRGPSANAPACPDGGNLETAKPLASRVDPAISAQVHPCRLQPRFRSTHVARTRREHHIWVHRRVLWFGQIRVGRRPSPMSGAAAHRGHLPGVGQPHKHTSGCAGSKIPGVVQPIHEICAAILCSHAGALRGVFTLGGARPIDAGEIKTAWTRPAKGAVMQSGLRSSRHPSTLLQSQICPSASLS